MIRDVKLQYDDKSRVVYIELSDGARFSVLEDSGELRLSCTDRLQITPIASNAVNIRIVE